MYTGVSRLLLYMNIKTVLDGGMQFKSAKII